MKKTILSLMLAAGLMSLAACGNHSDNNDSKEIAKDENKQKFDETSLEDDSKFAVSAADAGMLEVQLGKLAQSNGVSQQIKELGRAMEDDHGKANDELITTARLKNISLPTSLSEKSQKAYDDLAKKAGKDFDEAYADQMVKDHKDAIDLFKKEAEKGNDIDLKSWASGKLGTLEHHLMMSEAARDAVKK